MSLEHKRIPEIYGVYLLQSMEKPGRFYIGSTPHPLRRLRQHNGALAQGGAFRTKQFRPWKMVLFVHRFPSKIAALQFEHAWQHFTTTRYLKTGLKPQKGGLSGGGRSIKHKLKTCASLITCNGFKRMGLKCTMFDNDICELWKNVINNEEINVEFQMNDEKRENYNQLSEFMKSEIDSQLNYLKSSIEKYKDSVNQFCRICFKGLEQTMLMSFCMHCSAICHLDCSYRDALKREGVSEGGEVKQLVPILGVCMSCERVNNWNLIVRNSLALRNKFNNKEGIDNN